MALAWTSEGEITLVASRVAGMLLPVIVSTCFWFEARNVSTWVFCASFT